MRLLLSLLLLVVIPCAPSSADEKDGRKAAKREVSFGIEVAEEGLWREAHFRFERAAERDPDSASALNNLAVAREQQGDFEGARKAYEMALELKPDNIYIQQNYDLFREADDKRNRKKRRERR
jgi:Tfp pilus assembly protein PilF